MTPSPDEPAREGAISCDDRERRLGQSACTVWLTGLPGSGKSTLARALERILFDEGRLVMVLDGDQIRTGLCRGLGFSADDREENVRRVAEVARILNETGVICIAALVSPTRSGRERARQIIGAARFREVHVDAPVEVCETRDPKGLYRRARAGDVLRFTGVSDGYERPEGPDLRLQTADVSIDTCVARLRGLFIWARPLQDPQPEAGS